MLPRKLYRFPRSTLWSHADMAQSRQAKGTTKGGQFQSVAQPEQVTTPGEVSPVERELPARTF